MCGGNRTHTKVTKVTKDIKIVRAGPFPILSGPAALMAFELGSRKLFWSIFSQTVSVLVANSARLSPGEIVVDLLA